MIESKKPSPRRGREADIDGGAAGRNKPANVETVALSIGVGSALVVDGVMYEVHSLLLHQQGVNEALLPVGLSPE